MSAEKPREIALRILQAQGGDFVEKRLETELDRAVLSSVDRHLCQELVYGVVRWRLTLDWLIARKTRGNTQKPLLQNLLRLGLYQLFWLERIPPHAAVHETVELTKSNGLGAQAGFVNAVLRNYVREFDATKALREELKTTQPHLGYSHPEWLVKRWQQRFGLEQTSKLLAWNNIPPKTFARVNRLRVDPAKLLVQWRNENVEYDFDPHIWVESARCGSDSPLPEQSGVAREDSSTPPLHHSITPLRTAWLEENLVFELKSHPPLSQLPSFQQGLFYIQDPSTLLAVRELAPQPGETVLDLCAAPGGKLTYIAQRMHDQGRLLAHDLTPERLKLIKQNCERLGITCVETVLSPDLVTSSFDRILVDAPCSNTGVMRRRLDLRWRVTPEEISRLKKLQLALLAQAASRLHPGGTVVYSTCSLEPEENDQVVETFLKDHPGFQLAASHELRPFEHNVDGAFVARLDHKNR